MSMAPSSRARSQQAGMSLLELIVFILVVGIAVSGVLLVMDFTTSRSVDPLRRAQSKFIAEAYLEEILIKRFVDPAANTVCPAPPAARGSYNNVCDYNGLANTGAIDQQGNPIPGLSQYNVSVTVAGDAAVALNTINNTGAVRVLRIDVKVTEPGGTSLVVTGYRTNYNCFNAADAGCRPL